MNSSAASERTLTHYFDYKSPYAYLAQEASLALPDEFGITLELVPYTLDIPSYLGRAEVDGQGSVMLSERNAHQWRRVRYSYMDCRREANRRGLVIKGTRKIFDSSLAHIGFLFAGDHGDALGYHNQVFERFWCRELDIEDVDVILGVLESCGISGIGFAEFARTDGRTRLERLQVEAQARGVFGVPSYVIDGNLFWGHERLDRVREQLQHGGN